MACSQWALSKQQQSEQQRLMKFSLHNLSVLCRASRYCFSPFCTLPQFAPFCPLIFSSRCSPRQSYTRSMILASLLSRHSTNLLRLMVPSASCSSSDCVAKFSLAIGLRSCAMLGWSSSARWMRCRMEQFILCLLVSLARGERQFSFCGLLGEREAGCCCGLGAARYCVESEVLSLQGSTFWCRTVSACLSFVLVGLRGVSGRSASFRLASTACLPTCSWLWLLGLARKRLPRVC